MLKSPFKIIKRSVHTDLLTNYELTKARIAAASTFIKEIEKGNLDYAFEDDLALNDSDNTLAKSLLSLQQKMQEVAREEKQRSWVAEHRSQFIDILRSRNNDLKQLADDIISNLVKYLQANQGGLFVVNDDNDGDEYIELLACYAYERKKHLEQRIEKGCGLVGQTILEGETTYLSEIPQNYLRITSGLGDATPRYLLIVPLKIDEKVFGALEIASFKALAPYQIAFTEQLGESIASTISNTKNNERTNRLLTETQQQAEEMRAQEEEMRQNMEELQATQEEMHRKGSEIQSRLQAIDESGIASIEFDLDGNIVTANANFLKLMGYSLEEIKGRHHRMFVTTEYAASDKYRSFWKSLKEGVSQVGEYERVGRGNKRVFIQGSYSILRNTNGDPEGVLKLAADITSTKLAEEEITTKAREIHSRLQAIDESGIASIEFDLQGNIKSANANFLKLMGYSLKEIEGKHHRIFVTDEYAETEEYKQFWKTLGEGIAQMGEYERVGNGGKRVFIQGSYSILRDKQGNPESVLKLAADITSTKLGQEEIATKAREIHSRLQAIDESGIASIEFDLQGNIKSANTNFLKLMGYELEEIVGKHHRIFVTGEYAETEEYKQFWKTLGEGNAQMGEYERRRNGGASVYIQGSYSILYNKAGEPVGILKLAADITSAKVAQVELEEQAQLLAEQETAMRKNMEDIFAQHEQLEIEAKTTKAKEKRLSGMLDASPDVIFLIDKELAIIEGNKAFQSHAESADPKAGSHAKALFPEWENLLEEHASKALQEEAVEVSATKEDGQYLLNFSKVDSDVAVFIKKLPATINS